MKIASLGLVVGMLLVRHEGCDLVPDKFALDRSWVIDTINSDRDPCLQAEDCLSGPGMRTVLRFDSYLANDGRTDCTIGWTPNCPNPNNDDNVPDQYPFHYDKCHKHWHFTGFSEYYLYDMNGRQLAAGQKNGLCLMDVICTARKKFTCQNQGISPGCKDIYNKALNCQWIDITDLPDKNGKYRFEWHTNTARLVPESNYNNNIVSTVVDLSKVPRYSVRDGPAPNQCPRYGGVTTFQTPGNNRTPVARRAGNNYTPAPAYNNNYQANYQTQNYYNYPIRGNSVDDDDDDYTPSYSSYSSSNRYGRRTCRRYGYC